MQGRIDGGMGSTCCNSKQVKTQLLAEEQTLASEHEWYKCKTVNVLPEPSTAGECPRQPIGPVDLPHQQGRLQTNTRKISQTCTTWEMAYLR